MIRCCGLAFLSFLGGELARAQVVSYEGAFFPEQGGWERTPFCEPERSLGSGWLVQHVEVDCGGPPGGDIDRYVRSLSDFAGQERFFFEWRMETDGDRSEIPGVAPAFFTTADLFGVSYHFTVAEDQIRFIQDNLLPIVFVDIDPVLPHTYRLELYGSQLYVWHIDGEIVATGVPEGAYPTETAVLNWGAGPWLLDNTTRWDYIRYGTIPLNGSGDFDSDSDLDLRDYYFVRECLSNSGPERDAGPGCRFADFNEDSAVDLRDIATFQNDFTPSP